MAFVAGQLVWAKMKGYPWWPAKVAPEDDERFKKQGAKLWVIYFGDNTYNKAGVKELKDFEAALEVNESQTVAQQKTKTAVTWQLALKEAKQVLAGIRPESEFAEIVSTSGTGSGGESTTYKAPCSHGPPETDTGATTSAASDRASESDCDLEISDNEEDGDAKGAGSGEKLRGEAEAEAEEEEDDYAEYSDDTDFISTTHRTPQKKKSESPARANNAKRKTPAGPQTVRPPPKKHAVPMSKRPEPAHDTKDMSVDELMALRAQAEEGLERLAECKQLHMKIGQKEAKILARMEDLKSKLRACQKQKKSAQGVCKTAERKIIGNLGTVAECKMSVEKLQRTKWGKVIKCIGKAKLDDPVIAEMAAGQLQRWKAVVASGQTVVTQSGTDTPPLPADANTATKIAKIVPSSDAAVSRSPPTRAPPSVSAAAVAPSLEVPAAKAPLAPALASDIRGKARKVLESSLVACASACAPEDCTQPLQEIAEDIEGALFAHCGATKGESGDWEKPFKATFRLVNFFLKNANNKEINARILGGTLPAAEFVTNVNQAATNHSG